jgi:signal transduction histidine kinase
MRGRPEPTTRALAPRIAPSVAAVAAVAAAAGAVALILSTAPSDERALSACVHALMVLVPAGVGVAVLRRSPGDRFAQLLVTGGVLFSATALAESTNPTVYSVGRLAVWMVEPLVVYLLLAFPSGRLATNAERWTFRGALALVLVLYLPATLIAGHFPEPAPWSTCGVDCPDNALALTSSQPALVDDLIRPLREALTVVVFLAVTVLVVRRALLSGPMLRRALVPVAAIAVYRTFAFGVYTSVRAVDPGAGALEALGWLYIMSLPLVALSFGFGLVLRKTYAGVALQRLALELRATAGPAELRKAMAKVLEDPSLRILYRRDGDPGGWVDESGAAAVPAASPGVRVTEVHSEGRHLATLMQDGALAQDPIVTRAATAYALVVLENGRLVERLRISVSQLSKSRARLVGIADETRRGIERDLHDGAQQRLISLRIRLSVQAERLERTNPEAAAAIATLGEEVEVAIDELRSLAHGIYPALLTERGLADALRAVARLSPIPVSVQADGVGRYRTDVESTVYFACVEALQNAEKHAAGASRVTISLAADGPLTFRVCDDGAGFDARRIEDGSFGSLHDRLGAIGGSIEVRSSPGQGTCVSGTVPDPRPIASPASDDVTPPTRS